MKRMKRLANLPRGWRSETLGYADRVAANGGAITQGSLAAVDDFVRACQTAGLWEKLIEVGPFAGLDLNAALVKLAFQPAAGGVLVNSSFVAGDYAERGTDGGLGSDGTKYLSTNVLANTLPDTGHFSFYLREDISSGGNKAVIGALAGSDHYWMGALAPASGVDLRYGGLITAASGGILGKGFYTGSRESATALTHYRDGAAIGSAGSSTGTAKPALALHLWGFNSSGSSAGRIAARGSFYSIGQALSGAEVGALHQAVRSLQQALSRSVN